MDVGQTAGWLALGTVLTALSGGRWNTVLAAWVAPVVLLHVAAGHDALAGLLLVWAALTVGTTVAYVQTIPVPAVLLAPTMAGIVALSVLPAYAADRLGTVHLPGWAAPLLFPAVLTAVEYLAARLNPFGSWGSTAYSQYHNQPLMQLASVTGMWGITFIVAWFAAVANWAWQHDFTWHEYGGSASVFGVAFAVVMLGGAIRLKRARPAATMVVAGIGAQENLADTDLLMRAATAERFSTADRARARSDFSAALADMVERTIAAAARGAQVIVWHETSVPVLSEDQPALLSTIRRIAEEEQAYIAAAFAVIDRANPAQPRVANRVTLIGPDGVVASVYDKAKPMPGLEKAVTITGDGNIPVSSTPFGRLATAICSDLDHPDYLRQVGVHHADVLLVPASDWPAIKWLHPQQSAFRAVETGTAVVRANRQGVSTAFDAYGRLLGSADPFHDGETTLITSIPTCGQRTAYVRIGMLLAAATRRGPTRRIGRDMLARVGEQAVQPPPSGSISVARPPPDPHVDGPK